MSANSPSSPSRHSYNESVQGASSPESRSQKGSPDSLKKKYSLTEGKSLGDIDHMFSHGVNTIQRAYKEMQKKNNGLQKENEELRQRLQDFEEQHVQIVRDLQSKNSELLQENEELSNQVGQLRQQVTRLKRLESKSLFESASSLSGQQKEHSRSTNQLPKQKEGQQKQSTEANIARTNYHNGTNSYRDRMSAAGTTHTSPSRTAVSERGRSQAMSANVAQNNTEQREAAKFETRRSLDYTSERRQMSPDREGPRLAQRSPDSSSSFSWRQPPREDRSYKGKTGDASNIFRILKERIPEDRLDVLMNNLSRFNRGELDYDSVVTRAEVILCTPEDTNGEESEANKDLFELFCDFLSSEHAQDRPLEQKE